MESKKANVATKSTDVKKMFKVPHSFVIIMIIIIVGVILTWLIPAGAFKRIENAQKIKVIDPGSFAFTKNTPVSIFKVPMFIINGFISSADLFFLIILAGGGFNIISSSGALQAVVGKVAKKFANKEAVFIPILTMIFGLICTTQGVNTFIPFAPIMVLMAKALGFDSIVGVAVILLGGAVGFSTGMLNPSTTIVAQKIAELPLYSGIKYRAICFIVFMIVTDIYLVRYAMSIKKNPELSPMYEMDREDSLISVKGTEQFEELDIRRILVVISLVVTLGVIVYGGVKLDWGLKESSAAFIWLGIVAGLCAGFGPSKISKLFIEGAKKMVAAAMIIGLARAVSGVLTAGNIIDTVVYGLGLILGVVPKFLQGITLYILNLIMNIFITSGSGLASATMPIIIPLSDLLGVTRQTAVLAYNFGDGFGNYVLPTSTALMGIIGAANIPYEKWMRFMWRLFLIWVATGSVLLVIAQLINYGPM